LREKTAKFAKAYDYLKKEPHFLEEVSKKARFASYGDFQQYF
jgi:hypothetical protein